MIIGIAGKKQVGKNTVASMLQYLIEEKYDKEFTILPFAYILKKNVSDILHCRPERLEEEWFKEMPIDWLYGITPRDLLQRIGTEVGRHIDSNIWTESYFRAVDSDANLIIPDVRFKNEVDSITQRNGVVIHILRNTSYTDTHISETDLDNYKNPNYIIINNSDLSDLFKSAKNIVEDLAIHNYI